MNKIHKKINFAQNFSSLGKGRRSKILLFFSAFVLPTLKRKGIFWNINKTIHIEKFGREASFYLGGYSDLMMLKEIFMDGEYDVSTLPSNPRVIVDIGGNIGASALFFSMKYPSANIYVFEPNPDLLPVLQKNIGGRPHITILNYAITKERKQFDLYINPRNPASSSLKERQTTTEKIVVHGIPFDEARQQLSIDTIDILKFDIEGGEYDMLSTMDRSRVRYYVGEVHFDLMDVSPESFFKLFDQCVSEVRWMGSDQKRAILSASCR